MPGDERVRHCDRCRKPVFDLSSLSLDEAEALISRDEPMCVRFYSDAHGRIHTRETRRAGRIARYWRTLACLLTLGFITQAGCMRTAGAPRVLPKSDDDQTLHRTAGAINPQPDR